MDVACLPRRCGVSRVALVDATAAAVYAAAGAVFYGLEGGVPVERGGASDS